MNKPLFSVLLPTHNRLDLLTRAIETVRRQDFPDWEIIVSDNDSKEPVEDFVASLDDWRIKYVATEAFIPVTDNWQNALNHSTGDYLIMLGDDDGLLQGYFSTLANLIDKHQQPDFIYTGALLYAYPNVIPGCPEGFLRSYQNRPIYQNGKTEFMLDRDSAKQLVIDSMNFTVQFDYNMQFSLVSRKLIEKLSPQGDFYQSPYPDYYASNVIMWFAERVLVVPEPLVAVGISPKSFGYFYFNNAESEGNKFLNNTPSEASKSRLNDVILPGPVMNTSWLLSMETIAQNYPSASELRPNYHRYRLLQICAVFADKILKKPEAEQAYEQLKGKLSVDEWNEYGKPFLKLCAESPTDQTNATAQQIMKVASSHPGVSMPKISGDFSTMLDVFEQVKTNQSC